MIAAVLLAAGGSSRMGEPKQLMRVGGRSLVRRASEAALGSTCDALFVVTGAQTAAIRSELVDLAASIVVADDWSEGLSRSIRCGVEAVERSRGFDAVLLLLADQPEVGADHLDALIAAFQRSPAALAGTAYSGVVGVPAVFGSRHFDSLKSLEGDRGARALLRSEPGAVAVAFEPAARDIDTPDDLGA